MKNITRRPFVIFTFGLLFVFVLFNSKTYAGNLYYQNFSSYAAESRLTSAQTGGSAYYTSGSATAGGDNARISGAWEATNLPSLNTTGNYLMMWTDAGGPSIPTTDAGRTFFSQTLTVTQNTSYKVSYKVAGLSSTSLASVKMLINGTQVIATTVVTTNAWTTQSYTWNSGSNTSLTFSLINTNGSKANGNDLGLDDVLIEGTDLEITKSHTGNFTVGSTGTYSFGVKNTGGIASSGTITVSDTLPAGLTIPDGAITEGGTNAANWTCTAASNVITCTSSTAIAAGGTSTFSYSVNVGLGTAVGTNSITNTANVSGGGEIITTNNSASDPTTIVSPDLTISKSHTPTNFVRGSTGTYTIQVNNSGTAITSGLITVTDTLPIGLRVNGGAAGAVMIGGANSANWTCNSAAAANSATQTVTCTSSLAIPSGNSNTFTFDTQVTAGAINTLTNNVSVAGGGEVNTANNTDSDDTVIIASPNVTFSNYQCGANSNLRTITDWSDSGLPTTYGSGQYSFITPGSGITTTVSSSAPTIRKFADIGIPSPFGNNYLDISNGQESTVTINLSQAIRLQMMVADVDHSKIATIIGFNGTTRVFPQVVARSSFSPVVTNQATVVQIASTGVDSVNIGDFENSSTADVIFNSPVDKIVITNSGGLSGKTLDILNLVACGPSLNINKTTTGGTGSFTFNSTPSNGFDSTVLTTTTVATPVSSGYKYLVAANTATTITETITSGWSLTGASCVDGNSNSITSSLSGNILTLPASSIKLDTTISCSFTNSVSSPPYIALLKSCPTPANCTTAAQLPGTNVTYQIQFTNTGGSSAQSVKFVDNIPANTDYKIGSATNDVGTTGLTISIEYSNDYDPLNPTLATWTYTPVSGGGGASVGYDRLVKAIRWRVTAGSLSNVSPNNVGSVSFITKIR